MSLNLLLITQYPNINWAEAATSHCVSDLTHSQKVLDHCSDITALKQVVSNILSNTQSLTQTSQELRSELEKSSKEIEKLKSELLAVKEISRTDGLTGLLNRSTFDRELVEVCAHSSHQSVALVLFDLDHFKRVNDDFGHLIGDKVIQYFSSLLLKYSDTNHSIARFGGEEMVMILVNVSNQQAIEIADTIRSELADTQLKHKKNGKELGQITVSIGISFLQIGDTPNSFICRADQALYKAKNNGRNQIKIN